MASRTTKYSAEDIASALVGRNYAVGDKEGRSLDMVGNNTDRNVVISGAAEILLASKLAYLVKNTSVGVNLEKIANVLHNASKTLETHTGIDIGISKTGISTRAVAVKLGEYDVPNLYKSVAVAANLAIGLTAAVFFATVEINFRTGSARSGAYFPEVIVLAEANDTLSGNAVLNPDIKRLVVL